MRETCLCCQCNFILKSFSHKLITSFNFYQIFKILLWTSQAIALPATAFFVLNLEQCTKSLVISSIVLAFWHTSWAINIAGWIFLLHQGSLKPVNRFLSQKFWLNEKLGLSFYVMQLLLQTALLSSQKAPISFDLYEMVRCH